MSGSIHRIDEPAAGQFARLAAQILRRTGRGRRGAAAREQETQQGESGGRHATSIAQSQLDEETNVIVAKWNKGKQYLKSQGFTPREIALAKLLTEDPNTIIQGIAYPITYEVLIIAPRYFFSLQRIRNILPDISRAMEQPHK